MQSIRPYENDSLYKIDWDPKGWGGDRGGLKIMWNNIFFRQKSKKVYI